MRAQEFNQEGNKLLPRAFASVFDSKVFTQLLLEQMLNRLPVHFAYSDHNIVDFTAEGDLKDVKIALNVLQKLRGVIVLPLLKPAHELNVLSEPSFVNPDHVPNVGQGHTGWDQRENVDEVQLNFLFIRNLVQQLVDCKLSKQVVLLKIAASLAALPRDSSAIVRGEIRLGVFELATSHASTLLAFLSLIMLLEFSNFVLQRIHVCELLCVFAQKLDFVKVLKKSCVPQVLAKLLEDGLPTRVMRLDLVNEEHAFAFR